MNDDEIIIGETTYSRTDTGWVSRYSAIAHSNPKYSPAQIVCSPSEVRLLNKICELIAEIKRSSQ
jgi:hypothetical protein